MSAYGMPRRSDDSGARRNAIKWREWDRSSFERARVDDKLVMLYVGVKWCYLCRMVENTALVDDEVIKIINDRFVPIKVDADRRPDIGERYGLGGFPTIAVLAYSGDVLGGGRYVYPSEIRDMLCALSEAYRHIPAEEKNAFSTPQGSALLDMMSAPRIEWEDSMSEMIELDVAGLLATTFDAANGGFGSEPKFPLTEALDFLLYQYRKRRSPEHLAMVVKTLDGIANGLYDKIDGGFFRYSMTANWLMPRYEKLLDVNARLIMNFLRAFEVTGEGRFWTVADSSIGYALAHLYDEKERRFYGSQAADETYYRLGREQRGPSNAPSVDKATYTDSSAMMISSMLYASAVLENANYRKIALESLAELINNSFNDSHGAYHVYEDGNRSLPGMLRDNAYLANALIDAYEATGERAWIEHAASTLNFMNKYLKVEGDGYNDRPNCVLVEDDIGMLSMRRTPMLENSIAAIAYARLGWLLDDERYLSNARDVLSSFVSRYVDFGIFSPMYAQAAPLLAEPIFVTYEGLDDDNVKGLLAESMRIFDPRKVVNHFGGNDVESGKGIYVEMRGKMLGPIYDKDALKRAFETR